MDKYLAEHGRSSPLDDRPKLVSNGISLQPAAYLLQWNGIVAGVAYLHKHSPILIHGDLKPVSFHHIVFILITYALQRNVLIDDAGNACICDFGLVRIYLEQGNSGMTTTIPHTGTERYLAYELVMASEVVPTTATDIYAMGCIGVEESHLSKIYNHCLIFSTAYLSYNSVFGKRKQSPVVHFPGHAGRNTSCCLPR